ncbi:hypothetical protein CEXT_312111 [Caerostris extrusa]|uniref:Uncharacterized protein n=1 Tax=Caerostris extrusa TaxID=172846 RepID=A0AAV4QB81_CAEEX|nr:hypothetical protein CEXT_312111 [Caerostris extrusa]
MLIDAKSKQKEKNNERIHAKANVKCPCISGKSVDYSMIPFWEELHQRCAENGRYAAEFWPQLGNISDHTDATHFHRDHNATGTTHETNDFQVTVTFV